MSERRYVIIGNGIAANRAAVVLREGDRKARITIVAEECFAFYNRHLLPDFVAGKLREEDLTVNPPEFYMERKIKLRLSQKVVRIDPDEHIVVLGHKEKLTYSALVICSGGVPRIPAVYDRFAKDFFVLKTLADARSLRERLTGVTKVLFLGGDLIAVSLGKALKSIGKEVAFLLEGNAFWPLELTQQRHERFAAALKTAGFGIVEDGGLEELASGEEGGFRVRTKGGTEVEADLVGAFYGLVPDVGFLEGSGINVDRGILVDDHLRTNVPDVYAAGDCAKIYNPAVSNYWVSIGWPNAERLGECAAHNVLGDDDRTDVPPKSVFSFGDVLINTSWWKNL